MIALASIFDVQTEFIAHDAPASTDVLEPGVSFTETLAAITDFKQRGTVRSTTAMSFSEETPFPSGESEQPRVQATPPISQSETADPRVQEQSAPVRRSEASRVRPAALIASKGIRSFEEKPIKLRQAEATSPSAFLTQPDKKELSRISDPAASDSRALIAAQVSSDTPRGSLSPIGHTSQPVAIYPEVNVPEATRSSEFLASPNAPDRRGEQPSADGSFKIDAIPKPLSEASKPASRPSFKGTEIKATRSISENLPQLERKAETLKLTALTKEKSAVLDILRTERPALNEVRGPNAKADSVVILEREFQVSVRTVSSLPINAPEAVSLGQRADLPSLIGRSDVSSLEIRPTKTEDSVKPRTVVNEKSLQVQSDQVDEPLNPRGLKIELIQESDDLGKDRKSDQRATDAIVIHRGNATTQPKLEPQAQPTSAYPNATQQPNGEIFEHSAESEPTLFDSESAMNRIESASEGRRSETAQVRIELPRPVSQQLVDIARRLPDGAVEVRLAPDELGKVRFALIPQELGVLVQVQADLSSTMDLMRRNIDVLQAELRAAGYTNIAFAFGHGSPEHHSKYIRAENNFEEDRGNDLSAETSGPVAAERIEPIVAGRIDLRL